MFSILYLLVMGGVVYYSFTQSRKRLADNERAQRENKEFAAEAAEPINAAFIDRVSKKGAAASSDEGGVAEILHKWTPEPLGQPTEADEYDDVAAKVVQTLRRTVDGAKVAATIKDAYLVKYAREAQSVEGIANYIVNWWRLRG